MPHSSSLGTISRPASHAPVEDAEHHARHRVSEHAALEDAHSNLAGKWASLLQIYGHYASLASSADEPVAFMPMFSSALASRERTRDIGGSRSAGRKYRSVLRAEPTSSRVARVSGVLSWNQYRMTARC